MATVPLTLEQTRGSTSAWLQRGEVLSRIGLLLACALIGSSYVTLALTHARDRYQVYAVSGVHLGLAAHANHGTLYPPLFDGDRYAGTRYMPLAFLPLAGMAGLTGDYVFGGKCQTYALALILCGQLFVILRGRGTELVIAIAMACLVLVSSSGYLACMTIRGDLLPVVLQLGALLVIERSSSPRHAIGAGVLCALAVLAKVTALWAIPIVFFTLLGRRKPLGLQFLGTVLLALFLSLGIVQVLSAGRFSSNLAALSLADQESVIRRLGRGLAGLMVHTLADPTLTMLLIPASLLGLFFARQNRQWSIYHSSLLCSLLILAVILTEQGADYNHLLDVVVLSILATGSLWQRLGDLHGSHGQVRPVANFFLVWVMLVTWGSAYTVPLRGLVESRGAQGAGRFNPRPLASLIGPDERILAEDTLPEVCRGQKPTLLDTFMYARQIQARPELGQALQERIQGQQFDWILTRRPLDNGMADNDFIRNMGPTLIEAIQTHYMLRTQADGYFAFVPRRPNALALSVGK
jgi:hypothetical protein